MKNIFTLFSFLIIFQLHSQSVTTVAGPSSGEVDGPFNTCKFSGPNGICFDASGFLYVADANGYRIRKLDLGNSTVTTVAGTSAGYTNGTVSVAEFNTPTDQVVDNTGDIYVADFQNHVIRKVSGGMVSTFAGSTTGFANGPNLSAQFKNPAFAIMNSSGDIFVADYNNHLIRKISGGNVTTLAGSTAGFADGTGGAAQFNLPYHMAFDNNGDIIVVDIGNTKIRRVTQAGVVTTIAGSTAGYQDGPAGSAKFGTPVGGVAVDAFGNIYLADWANHKIRKVDTFGNVTTFAGSTQGYLDAVGTAAQLNFPNGITINNAKTALYFTDYGNSKVRKIDLCATPNLTLSASSNAICTGSSFTLNMGGSLNSATNWNIFNGGCGSISTGTTTSNSAVFTPTTTTTYYVRGEGGCITSTVCSAITVTVNPNPTLTVTSSSALLCSGESATLTANGASTYSWTTGSNTSTTVVNPTFSTTFTVSGTNSFGCIGTTVITQSVAGCLSMKETNTSLENIQLHPNPVNDNLTLTISNNKGGYQLILYNIFGQIVISQVLISEINSINVSGLVKGLYFYSVINGNKNVRNGKIIVE